MGKVVYLREQGFDVSVRAEPEAKIQLGVPVPENSYDLVRSSDGKVVAITAQLDFDLAKKIARALLVAAKEEVKETKVGKVKEIRKEQAGGKKQAKPRGKT